MIAQIIKNKYDNKLIECDVDILEFIKNPFQKSKSELPLWKFVSVKSDCEKIRNSKNYDKIHCLELDYDSGLTIEEFKQKYKNLEFYLYTTSSHIKGIKEKFRVIVPLKEFIEFSIYDDKIIIATLMEYFNGVDKSCFKNFHNLPNIPNEETCYEWFYNEGEKFGFELLNSRYEFLKNQSERESIMKTISLDLRKKKSKKFTEKQREAYKKKTLESLMKELNMIPNYQTGNRYNQLLSISGKFIISKYPDDSYIFDDHEVEDIILSHTNDKHVKTMVRNLLSKRS